MNQYKVYHSRPQGGFEYEKFNVRSTCVGDRFVTYNEHFGTESVYEVSGLGFQLVNKFHLN